MSQELARATLPRPEIMTATLHQKRALLAEVHVMVRRGEIGHAYDLRRTHEGWAVKVIRIAERPSWWHRNGLRLSLWGSGALGLLWLLSVLVRVLVAALASALPLLIGGGVLLGLLSLVAGPRVINIVQRVDVRK